MNILQMLDIPWDSGLAHYALILAQALKREGHAVYFSAIPGDKPWAKAHRLGLRTVPLSTVKGLTALRGFLKKHEIDLLNAHTGSTHSLAVASALGQKVAVVRTRSDARAIRRRVGAGFLFGHTQRIIAAADYIRESYVKILRLPPKKVVTVYQGVAVADFDGKAMPKDPIIGIVARLDPVKGHRYLLEALFLLKDVYPQARVRIIGQEENVKTRQLRSMAERLRVENRVSFEGFRSDVPAAMADCAIGVIASIGSEAVSRVALEWMASGRPVVATRVGCLPELVKESSTGMLVDPKDAPGLAGAIGKLLRDPSRAHAMGKAARQRAEDLFDMKRFVRETIEVYKDAVAEAKKA